MNTFSPKGGLQKKYFFHKRNQDNQKHTCVVVEHLFAGRCVYDIKYCVSGFTASTGAQTQLANTAEQSRAKMGWPPTPSGAPIGPQDWSTMTESDRSYGFLSYNARIAYCIHLYTSFSRWICRTPTCPLTSSTCNTP